MNRAEAHVRSLQPNAVPSAASHFITTSTLNYALDQTIANGIIVPAGTGGSIEIYARRAAHVILDNNGYFVEGVVTPAMV